MSKMLNHILCIDDEDDILMVATLCLEEVGGFQVTGCQNGLDGVEKAISLKPDLILIDVMMPNMDGPATLKKIRSHQELDHIPVVFMTARVQPAEIQEYINLGAADVVAKPFNPMTLSTEIQDIWDRLQ